MLGIGKIQISNRGSFMVGFVLKKRLRYAREFNHRLSVY
jgi:hypothetical protein